MWVGLEQALGVGLSIPIPLLSPIGPWCTPWSGIYARHTHSVYCPIPSVNVYVDKDHRDRALYWDHTEGQTKKPYITTSS